MGIFGEILHIQGTPGTIVFVAVLFGALIIDGGLQLIEREFGHYGYKLLVQKLYREFMILGFISFGTYFADTESIHDWYSAFHFAHTLLLFIAISFVIQSIIFVQLMSTRRRQLVTYGSQSNTSLLMKYHALLADRRKKKSYLSYWQHYYFHHGPLLVPFPKLRENIEFKIFQQFFIYTYNLPKEFNFANYTCETLKHYIISFVHVRPINWMILACLVALNYVRIRYIDRNIDQSVCDQYHNDHYSTCIEYVLRYAFLCLVGIFLFTVILLYVSEVYYQRLVDIVLDHEEFLQYQPQRQSLSSDSGSPVVPDISQESYMAPTSPEHMRNRRFQAFLRPTIDENTAKFMTASVSNDVSLIRSDSFQSLSSVDETTARKQAISRHRKRVLANQYIPNNSGSTNNEELNEHYIKSESVEDSSPIGIIIVKSTDENERDNNQSDVDQDSSLPSVEDRLDPNERDIAPGDGYSSRRSSLAGNDDSTLRRDSSTSYLSGLTFESLNDWRKARRRGSKDFFRYNSYRRFGRRMSTGSVGSLVSVASIIEIIGNIMKQITPSTDRRYLYVKSLERIWKKEQEEIAQLRLLITEKEQRRDSIASNQLSVNDGDLNRANDRKGSLFDGSVVDSIDIALNSPDIQTNYPFTNNNNLHEIQSNDKEISMSNIESKQYNDKHDESRVRSDTKLSTRSEYQSRTIHRPHNSLSITYSTYFEVDTNESNISLQLPSHILDLRKQHESLSKYRYCQLIVTQGRLLINGITWVMYLVTTTIAYLLLWIIVFLYRSLMSHEDSDEEHEISIDNVASSNISFNHQTNHEITDELYDIIETWLITSSKYFLTYLISCAQSRYCQWFPVPNESTNLRNDQNPNPLSTINSFPETITNRQQLQYKFHQIFFLSQPNLYYQSIELILLLQCFYVAIWLTNLIHLASMSSIPVLWQLGLSLPIVINFLLLRVILSTSSFIKSISDLNYSIVNQICEDAINQRNVLIRLRKLIRNQLKILTQSKLSKPRYIYLETLFQSISTNLNPNSNKMSYMKMENGRQSINRESSYDRRNKFKKQQSVKIRQDLNMISKYFRNFFCCLFKHQTDADPTMSNTNRKSYESTNDKKQDTSPKGSASSISDDFIGETLKGLNQLQFNFLLQSLQIRLTDQSAVKIFRLIDSDHDGLITWNDLSMVVFPERHERLTNHIKHTRNVSESSNRWDSKTRMKYNDEDITKNLSSNQQSKMKEQFFDQNAQDSEQNDSHSQTRKNTMKKLFPALNRDSSFYDDQQQSSPSQKKARRVSWKSDQLNSSDSGEESNYRQIQQQKRNTESSTLEQYQEPAGILSKLDSSSDENSSSDSESITLKSSSSLNESLDSHSKDTFDLVNPSESYQPQHSVYVDI